MQRLGFKSTCVWKAHKTRNWLNACSSQKSNYGWQWKRGTKVNFFLELNRTKLNISLLHYSTLNIRSYWFLDVPDQLSWRRQRHPRKNSAVEKLSQTGFVVLEGHRWWLMYELPSSNTSGTCGYRQNFCYWLELLMSLTTLFNHLNKHFLAFTAFPHAWEELSMHTLQAFLRTLLVWRANIAVSYISQSLRLFQHMAYIASFPVSICCLSLPMFKCELFDHRLFVLFVQSSLYSPVHDWVHSIQSLYYH